MASGTSNWLVSAALRTALPGAESGSNRRLIKGIRIDDNTLSCGHQSLTLTVEDFFQFLFRQSPRGGFSGDAVAESLKLGSVQGTQAVVFGAGENHGHVPLLAPDHDRLTLRGVQQRGEPLFCVRSGDVLHKVILHCLF